MFAHGGDVAIDEKYAKEFDDEDRGWWSDRYKEINGFRPTMSNTELIKWANENFTLKVTKSGDGSKVHKELIYKGEKLAKGGKLPPLPLLNEAYKYAKNRGVEYNGSFEEFKISFKKKTPKSAKYSEQVLKAVYYSLQQPEFGKGGIVDNVKKVIADKKAWKTYNRWETINNHSENAVLLVYAVGTKNDLEKTVQIM